MAGGAFDKQNFSNYFQNLMKLKSHFKGVTRKKGTCAFLNKTKSNTQK